MRRILDQLETRLQDQDYRTNLVPLDEEATIFQLAVDIDEEHGLRMTVFYLGDLLNIAAEQEEIEEIAENLDEKKADFLQLFIRFPVEFRSEASADLARLLLMINWSTPLGAFGVNESQQIIYYRHVFECMGEEPTVDLVLEAVNAMTYYAAERFESISLIASGQIALDVYVHELELLNRKGEEFPGYDL